MSFITSIALLYTVSSFRMPFFNKQMLPKIAAVFVNVFIQCSNPLAANAGQG
jgi:dimeric dUTPase (all-alpha-NTP-PPase superfamily)